MRVFITGGTGFIGGRLVERLVSEGHHITMLVRNKMLVNNDNPQISYVYGDLSDYGSLLTGIKGCEVVYHLAAYTLPWSADSAVPYEINTIGTENVLRAAKESQVQRVVITSTGGTMSFSEDGTKVDESYERKSDYPTDYDKTKSDAEKVAVRFSKEGLHVVIVNPTRVFGPGLLSKSNSLTIMISGYIKGKWRIIPGNGKPLGNYVFIDDVVDGIILAQEKGRSGERYILGGENLSFRELFHQISEVSGKRYHLFMIPVMVLKIFIFISAQVSRITGKAPLITSGWLEKYLQNWILSSDKAITELGYRITPFRTGVEKTIKWLNNNN
jgi:nucleoside-diphosphate-sugar epimerase